MDADPGSGRILLIFDGATTLLADTDTDWQTDTFTVPCGEHTIGLCLEVDEGDHRWVACFDNVEAICSGVVASEEQIWGTLKGLFRNP